MKRQIQTLLRVIIYVFLALSPIFSFGQSDDVHQAIESISKITASGPGDQTAIMLTSAGFHVPDNLKPSWNSFTAYRKIETAYWAAQKAGNGEKLLALISKSLAQQYESVSYEAPLYKYLAMPKHVDSKIIFGSLTTLELPQQVPAEIERSIGSIIKYTDAKALGGTRGVLKYYFDLPDDQVYKILRESDNDFDALLKGIEKASIPPSQKERLTKIVTDLQANYESANLDEGLAKIKEHPDLIKEKPGSALQGNAPKEQQKADYDNFVKKNHPNKGSLEFRKMKVNPEGFGGIIFGNQIFTAPNVGKLKRIIWIHGYSSGINSKTGELEFIFQDGSQKTYPNVLWEDVYAAYNILYAGQKNQPLNTINGIGLTGGFYPDVYNEDKGYDAIIRSHNLTPDENEYYTSMCNILKIMVPLRAKIKQEYIDKATIESKSVIEYESLLKGGEKLKKAEASRNVTEYLNLINKYKPIYTQFRQDSARFSALRLVIQADTEHYNKVVSIPFKNLDQYWKKKDSSAVANVIKYTGECTKIILHPAVANLVLGRCLIRADVQPRSGDLLIGMCKNSLKNESQVALFKSWLSGCDSVGWKFTDDSLLISSRGSLMRVARYKDPDTLSSQASILNFNKMTRGIQGESESIDFPAFYQVMPILSDTFYDYYRLNNFSKVMALVRWAKQNGAVFLNKPSTPPLYVEPVYTNINQKGTVDLYDK